MKLPDDEALASAEILNRIRNGDTSGFQLAFSRYTSGIRTIARIRLIDKDKADDVVQEVWLRMPDKLKHEPDNLTKLKPYLAQFTRNIAANQNASTKRESKRVSSDEVAMNLMVSPEHFNPFERLDASERLKIVESAIKELPPRDQDVLKSEYFSTESRELACTRLGLNSIQYSKVLSKARARLLQVIRRMLDES